MTQHMTSAASVWQIWVVEFWSLTPPLPPSQPINTANAHPGGDTKESSRFIVLALPCRLRTPLLRHASDPAPPPPQSTACSLVRRGGGAKRRTDKERKKRRKKKYVSRVSSVGFIRSQSQVKALLAPSRWLLPMTATQNATVGGGGGGAHRDPHPRPDSMSGQFCRQAGLVAVWMAGPVQIKPPSQKKQLSHLKSSIKLEP